MSTSSSSCKRERNPRGRVYAERERKRQWFDCRFHVDISRSINSKGKKTRTCSLFRAAVSKIFAIAASRLPCLFASTGDLARATLLGGYDLGEKKVSKNVEQRFLVSSSSTAAAASQREKPIRPRRQEEASRFPRRCVERMEKIERMLLDASDSGKLPGEERVGSVVGVRRPRAGRRRLLPPPCLVQKREKELTASRLARRA